MKEHTRPGGWHAIATSMPHVEDADRPGHNEILPWRDWYTDWEVVSFEEQQAATEEKRGDSDKWLRNTRVRLLARKPGSNNERS